MSAVINFPAARLARRRKAKYSQARELYRRTPLEFRPVLEALASLLTARRASEFGRARKELLALMPKLPEGARDKSSD